MTCREIRDYLDGMLLRDCKQEIDASVLAHAQGCSTCRADLELARRSFALLQSGVDDDPSADVKERIMQKLSSPSGQVGETQWSYTSSRIVRPLTAAAVAALIVMAGIVAITMTGTETQAYALQESVDAAGAVRSIHMRMTPASAGRVTELWAQVNERGELEKLRMNFSDSGDGPKDVIWQEGRAHVWFRSKQTVLTVNDTSISDEFKADYQRFDPKAIVEDLHLRHQEGRVNLEANVPDGEAGLITLTTLDSIQHRKDVYRIDSHTKLLRRHEVFRLSDGVFKFAESTDYLDYNQPIDPSVFVFELHEDIVRIDQTAQESGLEQGNLNDTEIAAKVVHEFLTALIAKDYAKASRLYEGEGMPAEELKRRVGTMNFTRILFLGTPEPHAPTRSLRVPCSIEVENNGTTSTYEPHGIFVRPEYGQASRWTISGGF